MAGFSYGGRNIGSFGEIHYIPDASERGEYALPFKVDEEEINGHDGAYYYGCHVEPRTFNLRCYYEGLSQRNKEEILQYFNRFTYAQLIFDDRPYAYYLARPYTRVTMEDYRVITEYNGVTSYYGLLTIPLRAYSPYGHLIAASMINMAGRVGTALVGTAIIGDASLPADNETLILPENMMPSNTFTTSGGTYLIYNPGTERTPLNIKLAGTATSGLITNLRNGQSCGVKDLASSGSSYLEIDSETGRVLYGGALNFEKHDYGYIWLEPCTPYAKDIKVLYTNSSKTIISQGAFTMMMIGQYVYLNGGWRKIASVTDVNTATLTTNMTAGGTETTNVVTMNELQFTGFDLTSVELSYSPRVR